MEAGSLTLGWREKRIRLLFRVCSLDEKTFELLKRCIT